MKNNYLIQRDKYSCGPIALMNILRWADPEGRLMDIKYQDIETFKRFLSTTREYGTADADLDYALKSYRKTPHFSLRITRKESISMREMERFLSCENYTNNKAIVLHYNLIEPPQKGSSIPTREGHYVLVIGMDDSKNFLTVNKYSRAPALKSCPRDEMVDTLRLTKPLVPFAWLITRQGY